MDELNIKPEYSPTYNEALYISDERAKLLTEYVFNLWKLENIVTTKIEQCYETANGNMNEYTFMLYKLGEIAGFNKLGNIIGDVELN